MAATQVIIVGGGLAGMSAAHTVLEAGGRVVLLDKSPFCGGNSTKATSGINGGGTRAQRKLGIPDSPEVFEADTAKSAGAAGRPPLIKALTHGSAPAVEWLMDHFGLDLGTVSLLAAHSHPRTHRAKDGTSSFPGMMITYRLIEALDDIVNSGDGRARVINKATVTRVLRDADGTINGVEYTDKDGATHTEMGPVVLATGGFGADFTDDSLLSQVEEKWKTLEAWTDIPLPPLRSLPTTNGPHCTGDGIKIALAAGANTADLHFVQVHPTGLVDPRDPDAKVKWLAAEALRGCGGILLDAKGRRFANELGKRDYVSGRMWKHATPPYRLVLNTAASKQISWHCEHYGSRGLMRKMTGADLAADIGIPPAQLQETFTAYNGYAQNGGDPWGKVKYPKNTPIEVSDTFHVAFVTPVIHYCMGGIEGDEHARVLTPSGDVVHGLFAAGEVLGGVHGNNRLGGSSLLDCVVFGRIAGSTAARYLLSQSLSASRSGSAAGATGAFTTSLRIVPGENRATLDVAWDGAAAGGAGGPAPVEATPSSAGAPAPAAPTSTAAPEKAAPGKFTLEEVATHNTETDCWVIIDDKVYDVTEFLADHPGGKAAILIYAGKDATKEFKMMHQPDIIDRYGSEFYVGDVVGGAPAPAAAAAAGSGGGGASGRAASGTFTAAEVASHNNEEDCWVIINDKVYDVTEFLGSHPGGKAAILNKAGADATKEFTMIHSPSTLENVASKFCIGDLVDDGDADDATGGAGGEELDEFDGTEEYVPDTDGLAAGEEEAWNCGGTAGELPRERKRASFVVETLTDVLNGGPDGTKRRRFILKPLQAIDNSDKYNMSRGELMMKHFDEFIAIHKAYTDEGYIPKRDEVVWMSECATNTGSFMSHMALFLPTILGMASPQQQMWWLPRTLTFKMVGSYAQTELGHGSNVRGLRTRADYDKSTQEFVLNTPTLQSMKWWNSNIGLAATHAVVYAQLCIDGKEYGVHPFMVQIRDEDHHALPGCEMGDVGPKLGDAGIDTGYLRLKDVRIPREHLFGKRQHVTPEGKYVKHGRADKGNDKAHYATMMQARAGMIQIAGGKLGIAATIATRYSCVRRQGFADAKAGISYKSEERQIIDYGMQQYRLFKQIAFAYAFKLTGKWLNEAFQPEKMTADDIPDDIAEIHATSAGLKGLCTEVAAAGIEDLRKCCGGHGYMLASGVAALAADYVWQTTAEGDFIVMLLQTARFLLKAADQARAGERMIGTLAYLAPLAKAGFKTRDAAPRPARSVADLLQLEHLEALFAYRAISAVWDSHERFQAELRKGTEYADAFNKCMTNLVSTSRSHCYLFLVHRMFDEVRATEDAAVRAVLQRLAQLFALVQITEGQQWTGIVDHDTIELAETGISQLLKALRPDAVSIVDAFDYPDVVLGSALGRFDGNVYEDLYANATTSRLNTPRPFRGYTKYLRPHLDRSFLKLRNKVVPESML